MQEHTPAEGHVPVVRQFNGLQTLAWFIGIAASSAVADWLSKAVAVGYLSDRTLLYGSRFGLMLVFNKGGAGGVSWGPHTHSINICLTALSVLMISGIVAQLAKIDARAAIALGLVAGGASGNLISMVAGQDGVVDFLALRLGQRAIVCNVADIALWGGAILLIPVVRSLMRAIRRERTIKGRPHAFVDTTSAVSPKLR